MTVPAARAIWRLALFELLNDFSFGASLFVVFAKFVPFVIRSGEIITLSIGYNLP